MRSGGSQRFRAADFRRGAAFAAFFTGFRAVGFRFVVVVAMGAPLSTQANHLHAERITADSGDQAWCPISAIRGLERYCFHYRLSYALHFQPMRKTIMRTTLFALAISVTIGSMAAQAQPVSDLPRTRSNVKIVAIMDGCSKNNPLYVLEGGSTNMNVRVCTDRNQPGRYERRFKNYNVGPTRVQLGCEIDGGSIQQRFTIHWQEAVPQVPPADVTTARNNLNLYRDSCGNGTCNWFIANNHNTKPIQVNFNYRGRPDSILIDPQEREVALGPSATAPQITRAEFLWDYSDVCNHLNDHVPNIPVVFK